jgi:hypothetical protein
MELIAAVFIAGPLGYFARTSRLGLVLYLIAWAVILPIQTVVVYDAGDGGVLYWIFNALILAGGLTLNRFGRRRREARDRRRAVARPAGVTTMP